MGFVVVLMIFWLYVGMQQALFVPIDDGLPYYQKEWLLPITDAIYRIIRVAGCVCVFLTIKGLLPVGIVLYLLAWLIKKVAIYFTYRD